ncbi:NAD(P)H-dependent oxidoreductase [Pedobacter sp. SYP-B3415]|uniref:NAD(P)H-dependent oxidoreductase n=1 Tax=Pedobacter sp. SYP-B3415 TaxID=2496641 RepID=UPI00101C235D|nr:NAD(P)H-dependent oxidoreductase [Pedobacter sp. SYP-B3415]
MKQLLILNADLEKSESTRFLIDAYINGAVKNGAVVKEIAIVDLIFNSNKQFINRQAADLEPDLQKSFDAIKRANHIVLFCPVYVDVIPAKVKGFFDRLFLPDSVFTFQRQSFNNNFSGTSARIVSILDQATFEDWKQNKKTTYLSIKRSTFENCRISPVHTSTIGHLLSLENDYSKKWLRKMEKFGLEMI